MHDFRKGGLFNRVFQIIAVMNVLAVMFILSIYAYIGVFSRYQADDYCNNNFLLKSESIFGAVLDAYNTWLNSYSILVVLQLVEWTGQWGIRLVAAFTILVWVAGLTWLFSEIAKAVRLRLGFWVNLWLAGLVVFLSLYQAPNLHQILYWRAAMVPYTMPLFFFVYIAALILWYARLPYQKNRSILAGLVSVFLVFFTAGLGETTGGLQVGLFFIAVLAAWLANLHRRRTDIWNILLASLAVAVISLLIIAFSPGTAVRLDTISTRSAPVYNPILLSVRTITYTSQFILDTFKTLPLPTLFAAVVPFGIVYSRSLNGMGNSPQVPSSRIRLAALAVPIFVFIAIGFSFAPSAFAQSYPVARARFAAHFILTLGLLLEGGVLGMLAAEIRLPAKLNFVRSVMILLMGLALVYPMYASTKLRYPMAVYQRWAAQWDERDAYIRQAVAEGATDLEVEQLDTIGGVQEYKYDENHWVNKCAAEYYGLRTLRAP
jgi:hypothetical protein